MWVLRLIFVGGVVFTVFGIFFLVGTFVSIPILDTVLAIICPEGFDYPLQQKIISFILGSGAFTTGILLVGTALKEKSNPTRIK